MNAHLAPEGWAQFIEFCSKVQSTEELNRLFDLFLTIEEKHLLASRYLIIKALFEGKQPQRQIAKTHQVSIAQITRGSNALKIINPALARFLRENLT